MSTNTMSMATKEKDELYELMVGAQLGSLKAIEELGRRWPNDPEDGFLGLGVLISLMTETLASLQITTGEILPVLAPDVARTMSAVLDILDLLLSAPGKDIRIVRMLMVNLTIIILFQRMCRTPYRLLEAMKGFLESLETNDASSLQQLCDPLCFTWITQPLSSADHDDYAGYVVFLEALTNHDLFGKTVIQVIEQALPLIGQRMSGNFLRVLSCLHQAFLSFPLDSEELSMHWLAVFLRFHDAIVPLLSAQSSELKKLFIEYDFFQLYLQSASCKHSA
ncbi:hypothetical protein CC1G_13254 [Coprinopsis cinerea okayama7|uniref:Uncharacterized protein n=1 Tax=Coprinopsis cinerea (strain Okayama-7 / 130 / ATCC MYA-4618 / FGSC 9003) TaxID=240176 RepID=A8PI62_COPC7|nr:hypothetical protein CC1G_13254 [Coprinopsis cinerea okayama7\|eukprot:XP_001841522.2 hypothetical protein CC1G_13254 [Coprinopsis cinerea okayama7\